MCRVVGYLGRPVPLERLLYETDSSLARQAYDPRMMRNFLNLAGFGVAAWDARWGDEPFTYRVTALPTFDRNLRSLARRLEPTCVLAHVRGVTWSPDEVVSPQNLHPFHFPRTNVMLAHNGFLREFPRMRYDLVRHIRPEFSERIEGTTDSEWMCAVLLSQLADPYGRPDVDELAEAVVRTLAIVREVRRERGIDTSSPANLFVTTGDCLVTTRFSYDYGWYPPDDTRFEPDTPYVSLWYTVGGEYARRDGAWQMTGADGAPQSLLIASEPLTADISTWLEAPEYSLATARLGVDGLELEIRDLDI